MGSLPMSLKETNDSAPNRCRFGITT
jgi:hypothetical protein